MTTPGGGQKTPIDGKGKLRASLIRGVSCVILAGGESRRMGTNKALVEIKGKALVERVLERVGPLFEEVMISAHGDEGYSYPGTKILKDTLEGRGPAVGVSAALQAASNDWVFIVACDQPLVSAALIRKLAALAVNGTSDAVVPRAGGRVQTMCALYKKTCLAPLEERVKRGRRGLVRFLEDTPALEVRYVGEEELAEADPKLTSFIDVDTKEDLTRAEELLTRKE